MELREKIAREIQRSHMGFPTENLPLMDRDWATADRVLALPEIREALAYLAELGPINHEVAALIQEITDNPEEDA